MKMKKLAVSILSAGLIMSLGIGSMKASAEGSKSTEAFVTFDGGALVFSDVSESITFKDITIGGELNEANEHESEAKSSLDVKVNDFRGNGDGWTVSATFKGFSKENSTSLKASSINLSDGKVTADEAHGSSKNPTDDLDEKVIKLEKSEAVPIVNAKGNDNFEEAEGRGTWNIKWEADNVQLNVPATSAEEGKHKTVINWTFTDDMTS